MDMIQFFGARPLKRIIQRDIENPISKIILSDKCMLKKNINAVIKNNKIDFLMT